jgi:hypothetical protein
MKRKAKASDNLIHPTQGAQVGRLGYSSSLGELGEPGVINRVPYSMHSSTQCTHKNQH